MVLKPLAMPERLLDALGDPTRRRIFARLHPGPQHVAALAKGMPVSRPAVSQHLRVLQEAGLVRVYAAGTRRIYAIDTEGLAALRAWLDQFWDDALARFKAHAESPRPAPKRKARP